MKTTLFVAGFFPAYSKEVNKMMAAMDLGIEGAYRPRAFDLNITHERPFTPQHLADLERNMEKEFGATQVKIVVRGEANQC